MYYDQLNGIKSGYAKFETFLEPALAPPSEFGLWGDSDLDDVNMIGPIHLQNLWRNNGRYNRDIEIFLVLKRMLNASRKISLRFPNRYGVNMVGFAIVDNGAIEASKQEIIRRYYQTILDVKAERWQWGY